MKTRKLLALALALVMTFSLVSMAFAADQTLDATNLSSGGTTTSTGTAKGMTIKITVPGTQNFVINPYGLTAKLTINGDDSFSDDQIFCAPAAVVSMSDVPIQVSATVTGNPTGITLKESAEEADPSLVGESFDFNEYSLPTTKDLFAYIAFLPATSDDEGVVQDYPDNWAEYTAPEDSYAETILVKGTTSEKYIVGELTAMTCAEGETTASIVSEGNALAFMVLGNANPFVGGWSSSEKLVIQTVFTFKTMSNY